MARKKWRIKVLPTFVYLPATSKPDAYRTVARYAADIAQGRTRVEMLVVECNDGHGWERFEKFTRAELAEFANPTNPED